jgi:soluble lytic murein transglycosylase-like protein
MESRGDPQRRALGAAIALAALAALLACAAAPVRKAAPLESRHAPYRALVERSARKHDLDPRLILGLIEVESNFDPKARSRSGACGLMQLMPETGRRFGARKFDDPAQNIEAGTSYVRYLVDLFGGDVDRAIAGYNVGEMAVFRAGGVPQTPAVLRFVGAVKAAAQRY